MHCVSAAVFVPCSCLQQPQQLQLSLISLSRPILQPIEAAMHQFTPSLGAGETALASQLPLFDRLSTLFQCIRHQQAAAQILQQAWSPLDAGLQRAVENPIAVERLCRFV